MILAYTGLPVGGKSLSALQDYLLPQLKAKRHVYCNIVGLNLMLIAAKLGVPSGEVNRYLHRFTMSFDAADAQGGIARRMSRDGCIDKGDSLQFG